MAKKNRTRESPTSRFSHETIYRSGRKHYCKKKKTPAPGKGIPGSIKNRKSKPQLLKLADNEHRLKGLSLR